MGERIRGSAGVKLRKRRLARTGGLCERCGKAGRVRLATRVDHIKPLALGGEDVDENTRNLCEPCHLDVTAEQFGHASPIEGRGVDRSGRPTSPDHPWNRGVIGGAA
ncbi:HNH endonuclease [Rhizorhabdus histidinilytica]|uniref:5-methylcytosine-specific restriction enzyme A n=1 Tax=Rhizorhabdus histidinilytica TaxID=439228 RepID=A0A1T5BWJ2_9SPHN|nr:HNH endonuclease [Rhizorhabdus histidinilytica]SKB51718.1 5-methylcytosine-specific restriction enzyme A [Rhizorhabdus histidinilytica]